MNEPKVSIKIKNNVNEVKGKKFYFFVYDENTTDIKLRYVNRGTVYTKKNIIVNLNETILNDKSIEMGFKIKEKKYEIWQT